MTIDDAITTAPSDPEASLIRMREAFGAFSIAQTASLRRMRPAREVLLAFAQNIAAILEAHNQRASTIPIDVNVFSHGDKARKSKGPQAHGALNLYSQHCNYDDCVGCMIIQLRLNALGLNDWVEIRLGDDSCIRFSSSIRSLEDALSRYNVVRAYSDLGPLLELKYAACVYCSTPPPDELFTMSPNMFVTKAVAQFTTQIERRTRDYEAPTFDRTTERPCRVSGDAPQLLDPPCPWK